MAPPRYGACRPLKPRLPPKPLPGAPLPLPPCRDSPRIHPGVVLATVASLGLVTTDSSLGRLRRAAPGSQVDLVTSLTRLAVMSSYAAFVRCTGSSSSQMDTPAELMRLAISPSTSAKLSAGLKMVHPEKAVSRQPLQLDIAALRIWPKSSSPQFSRWLSSLQHIWRCPHSASVASGRGEGEK